MKRLGILGVSVRKKELTTKIETVTLNGKDGQNMTCFVYKRMKSIEIHLLSRCFSFGGHLRLELSYLG